MDRDDPVRLMDNVEKGFLSKGLSKTQTTGLTDRQSVGESRFGIQ